MQAMPSKRISHKHLKQLCLTLIRATDTPCRKQRRLWLKRLLKQRSLGLLNTTKKILCRASCLLAAWGVSAQLVHAQPAFKHLFLQTVAIKANSSPSFADIDGDGDDDVFIGAKDGTLKFYRNEGNSHFSSANGQSIINPLAGIDVGSISAATLLDIDGDGDLDAFIGNNYGSLNFYQNEGTATQATFTPADGQTIINPLIITGYQASHPSFADIDGDGDLDAFIGTKSGLIKFYQNSGSRQNPSFVPSNAGRIINPLSGINAGTYSVPNFIDIDNDGDLDLFIGQQNGHVNFYQNDGLGHFNAADGISIINPLGNFNVGLFASPDFSDIDNDGDLDAIIGEKSGHIKVYQNDGTGHFTAALGPAVIAPLANTPNTHFGAHFVDIDGDGDLDLFVGQQNGRVNFYRNDGLGHFNAANGSSIINPLANVNVGQRATPTFADIDKDGDLDAFIGAFDGTFKFYQNDGNAVFTPADKQTIINPFYGLDVGYQSILNFTDIDSDGDLDAFIGEQYGSIKMYQNDGTGNFLVNNRLTNPFITINAGVNATISFADIDQDGDLDAFIGEKYGTVKFYQNDGNNVFTPADGLNIINPLGYFNFGNTPVLTFTDTDNDGDLDAFVGSDDGRVLLIENFDPSPITHADTIITIKNQDVLNIDVFSNDQFKVEGPITDFNFSDFTPTVTSLPSQQGGTLTLNTDNTLNYAPPLNFSGDDAFIYTLSDGAGNTASNTLNLIINPTAAPVIRLLGDNPLVLTKGATFTDPGHNVIDDVDTHLIASVTGTVDTNTPGLYSLIYTVKDSQGNSALPVSRLIRVKDQTPPVITLVGDNPLLVSQGDAFIDPGSKVADNINTNLVAIVTGNVNSRVIGDYILTYNAKDSDGNFAKAITRTVKVISAAAPVIILNNDSTLLVAQGTPFTDPGSVIIDDVDTNLSATVSGKVDTQTIGSYLLIYTVTDTDGNVAFPRVRAVRVTDQTPPTIVLSGQSTLTLPLSNTAFIDPGFTVTDNVDSGLTPTVIGLVNSNRIGTYTLTYNVSDAAGNVATPAIRTVIISPTPPSQSGGGGRLSWLTLCALLTSCFILKSRRKKRL